ncbi:MAG: Probable transmembrane protein [uncultured Sulfurovum sp.]|uniref:Probable transmembrane protein n=1 Tax=uncultured Sulfurovum sp. TaxID=269237 RepID=A0A6S6T9W8_9BACT|nr:MAG: Probable transmembrane protein [uncultured Sulfurovum sp.]
MTRTIGKSFKDILSATVLLFVIKVGLISLVITALILWSTQSTIHTFIGSYLSWLPWDWLKTTGASVASVAISYLIFVITISVVTSFMIEPLLIKLAKKHYPKIQVTGSPNVTTSTVLSLKSALIAFVLFIFTFPMMFVPLLGAVYMLWIWSILLKAPTIYDVSSLFIEDKRTLKDKTKRTTMLSMIAAGFNYIPILNIFAAVFAQILFLHHILGKENN